MKPGWMIETRSDGWPLCPRCGEDELYSFLEWDGNGEKPPMEDYLNAGLKCYRCGRSFARSEVSYWTLFQTSAEDY